jgi:hypothetical protein
MAPVQEHGCGRERESERGEEEEALHLGFLPMVEGKRPARGSQRARALPYDIAPPFATHVRRERRRANANMKCLFCPCLTIQTARPPPPLSPLVLQVHRTATRLFHRQVGHVRSRPAYQRPWLEAVPGRVKKCGSNGWLGSIREAHPTAGTTNGLRARGSSWLYFEGFPHHNVLPLESRTSTSSIPF